MMNTPGCEKRKTAYGGALYSDVKYVEILEGSVCYTSGIAVGKKVTTGITGQILELYQRKQTVREGRAEYICQRGCSALT